MKSSSATPSSAEHEAPRSRQPGPVTGEARPAEPLWQLGAFPDLHKDGKVVEDRPIEASKRRDVPPEVKQHQNGEREAEGAEGLALLAPPAIQAGDPLLLELISEVRSLREEVRALRDVLKKQGHDSEISKDEAGYTRVTPKLPLSLWQKLDERARIGESRQSIIDDAIRSFLGSEAAQAAERLAYPTDSPEAKRSVRISEDIFNSLNEFCKINGKRQQYVIASALASKLNSE